MQKSNVKSLFREEQKELIFTVSEEVFKAFRKGLLHNEMFLPYSDLWKRRLLEGETWSLQQRIYDFKVKIVNANNALETFETKPSDATVRRIPIRKYERTGKHIVLRLKPLS